MPLWASLTKNYVFKWFSSENNIMKKCHRHCTKKQVTQPKLQHSRVWGEFINVLKTNQINRTVWVKYYVNYCRIQRFFIVIESQMCTFYPILLKRKLITGLPFQNMNEFILLQSTIVYESSNFYIHWSMQQKACLSTHTNSVFVLRWHPRVSFHFIILHQFRKTSLKLHIFTSWI